MGLACHVQRAYAVHYIAFDVPVNVLVKEAALLFATTEEHPQYI
jgi:hypothetical protein